MPIKGITDAELREHFSYDPETGLIRWLKKPSRNICIGDIAGTVNIDGYINIRLFGKSLLAHHIAWILDGRGAIPELIDHKDRIRHNNKRDNLRASDKSGNSINSEKTLKSGIRVLDNKYYASVTKDGVVHHERFPYNEEGLEKARLWRANKLRELHGEFLPESE